MVIFGLELPIEPAGKIAQCLNDGLFTPLGRRLPGRAVARHVDAHAVFVVVAPTMGHIGDKLIEVLPLSALQAIRDAVQGLVLRGVGTDFAPGPFGKSDRGFEGCAVPLRREPREPDAGFLADAATHQPDGPGLEADPQNVADALEVVIDRIPPIVGDPGLAIPAAGFLLCGVGQFWELIDRGADHLRCRNGAATRR